MLKRSAAATVSLLVLLAALMPSAAAQSDSGEIDIVVVDATTKQPLELARVLLDGPVITSELTGKNGKVVFTDVPDGIYRARIVRRGYTNLTSASFEVLDGRIVTVNFALALATGGLKIIGEVTAKASATISSTSIDQNSPQRRLSTDLADALNKLSGVTVSTSSDDSDATQTISLEGHDPSQTQLTLDGIPLNAPGSTGNLGGFATDLFQGASVHMGPTLGGLGGSVNFSTLQPTLSWITQLQMSTGSYGRYNYSIAETGSVGKLGLAVQTVDRLYPSLVDGDLFQDASGLDYVHDGDSTISGNVFSTRYEFGDNNSLSGLFMNSTRNTSIVCLRYNGEPATTLPCGYGPNNTNSSNVQLYSLADNALIGATQLQTSVYSLDSSSLLNELARYVNGLPSPTGYSSDTRSTGYVVNATLPAKERHTLSIQAYGSSSQFTTTPLIPQAAEFYSGAQTTQYDVLQATDTIHSSDKLTLVGSAGLSTATGNSGISQLASVAATWHPTIHDTYSASFALGGAAATQGRLQILSDPASLRFDCVGKVAYGNAPGEQPQNSSSNSLRVSYTHQLHGGNVSVTLYRQLQNGVLLPVYVDGYVLNQLGALPAGYLQEVAQIYNSPAGCNTPPVDAIFGPATLLFDAGLRRAASLSRRGADGIYHARQSRRSAVLQSHRRPGSLEQLPVRQPVVDHDPKSTASQRSVAKVRHRAGLQGAQLDARVARRCTARRHEQSEQSAALHDLRRGRHGAAHARNANVCGNEHHRRLRRDICEPGERGAVYDRRRIRYREHRAPADAAHVFIDVFGALRSGRTFVADRNRFPRSRRRRRPRR